SGEPVRLADAPALAAAERLDIGSQSVPPRHVSAGRAAARAALRGAKKRDKTADQRPGGSRSKRPKRRLRWGELVGGTARTVPTNSVSRVSPAFIGICPTPS